MMTYGPGGAEPKITIEQLKRMIRNQECPDVLEAVREQVGNSIILRLEDCNAARVEKINRIKTGSTGWQIELFTDDQILQISGYGVYRRQGEPPKIKLTEVTLLHSDGVKEKFTIIPPPPAKPKEKSRRRAQVGFDRAENRWTCACLYRNELYCDHILTHLEDKKDRQHLDKICIRDEKNPIVQNLQYPLASGLVEMGAILTVMRGEWLDLEDEFVRRLSWNGFEQWLSPEDSGASLIAQVERAVTVSSHYKAWYQVYVNYIKAEIPHTPHQEIATTCGWKNHSPGDSKMVIDAMVNCDLGLSSVILANGFTSMFHQRCLSCWRAVNMHELNLPSEDAVPSRMQNRT